MMQKAIIRWLTVVALLTWATPAASELTDAEKSSLLYANSAMNGLTATYVQWLGPFVSRHTKSDGSNRESLFWITLRFVDAMDYFNEATAALFGADVTDPPTTFAAKTRPQKVTHAWAQYDLALKHLAEIRKRFALIVSDSRDVEYQTNVRTMTSAVEAVEKDLKKMDRTLPFSDPRPPKHPTVIGPHGKYDDVQRQIWQGVRYAHRGMRNFLNAYRAGFKSDYGRSGKIYVAMGSVSRQALGTMFLVGQVPWTDQQRREDQFFRIVHAHERLTSAENWIPAWFFNAIGEAEYYLRETAHNPVALEQSIQGMRNIGDAWRHTDHAAWMLMIFPNCDPVVHPTGCGGR